MTITEHVFPPPPRASTSRDQGSLSSPGERKMNGDYKPVNGNGRSLQSSPSFTETLNGDAHTGLSDETREVQMSDDNEDDDMDLEDDDRPVIHVEVKLKAFSSATAYALRGLVISYIKANSVGLVLGSHLKGWEEIPPLRNNVESIWVDDSGSASGIMQLGDVELSVHLYRLCEGDGMEEFCADEDEDEVEGEKMSSASIRSLPSSELDGLWKNLVYADDLKSRLLQYISTAMQFSEAEVDFNIVTWNRMVLLYGPPGTGKTSLCRALAQKLAIRMSHKYSSGKLVEINSHSLFSKWFSESGKMVQRLFTMVHQLVDDEQNFVVVMIDEVESLTRARSAASSGNEPSDAIRVVNALLTQLDKLKEKPNVLVMTTSNLSETIDPAFVDRADIKEYVGNPPPQAIYWILSGCLQELVRRQLIREVKLLEWTEMERLRAISESRQREKGEVVRVRSEVISVRLADLANQCCDHELSGRLLRRIPMLAHARYIARGDVGMFRPKKVEIWLDAMSRVLDDEIRSKVSIGGSAKREIGTQKMTAGMSNGH